MTFFVRDLQRVSNRVETMRRSPLDWCWHCPECSSHGKVSSCRRNKRFQSAIIRKVEVLKRERKNLINRETIFSQCLAFNCLWLMFSFLKLIRRIFLLDNTSDSRGGSPLLNWAAFDFNCYWRMKIIFSGVKWENWEVRINSDTIQSFCLIFWNMIGF